MNTDPWTRAPWVGRWPGRYPSQPRVRGRWGSRRPWWSSLPALRYPSAPASGPHTDCAEGNVSGARRISSSGCCRQHLMERNRGYQYPVSTGRHQFLLYTQRYLYSVLIQWYQSISMIKVRGVQNLQFITKSIISLRYWGGSFWDKLEHFTAYWALNVKT